MPTLRYLDDDLVRVFDQAKPDQLITTLFWGDQVTVLGAANGQHQLDFTRRYWDQKKRRYETKKLVGIIPARARFRERGLLKVYFVDVGQGDGTVVQTPQGRLLLIDAGEELHMQRYLNSAFAHVLREKPLHFDALLATHGDADHFAGLTRVVEATVNNRPLLTADRVFHSGLVKGPSKLKDKEIFGASKTLKGVTYAVDLADDLLTVPDARMNEHFLAWKQALRGLKTRCPQLSIRRLSYGNDDAFDFLRSEGIATQVLGPIQETVSGKPALRYFSKPGSKTPDAGQTINGHSIVLRLTLGNVRFLFGGDLNDASENTLLARARKDNLSLAAEVLKVPHHGSEDFSPPLLEAIRPVVSVISSGDENERVEYIHPRAGLVGALGKYSRATVERPLVYVTEMVAFFKKLGLIHAFGVGKDGKLGKDLGEFQNAYHKTIFGIVHVRTDGERVLVATNSGRDDRKESYAFRVDANGGVVFEEPQQV